MDARPRLEPRREPFRLGDWLAQPSRNRLERDGIPVVVRPKAMDVLAILASRPGEVVTRDALMDAVWPGSFAGDGVLCRAVYELREALGDSCHAPRYIETVARRGYRLAEPVREPPAPCATPAEQPPPAAPPPPGHSLQRRRLLVAVAAAAMLTLGALLATSHWRSPATVQARSLPRVAVLPFDNLGGADDEYLAAGLAEEISGRLAGLRGLVVVPPTAALTVADRATGAAAIGRRLAADYLVTGGTRWDHATNRVRVTPRVVRVADDTQIWAEVLDRDTADLLQVQAEIAATVAGRLQVALQQSELASLRRAPTSNPEAYRAYLEGRWHTRRPRTSGEGLLLAVRQQERATALDPAFAEAWAELARDHADLYHVGGDLEPSRCRAARAAARQAVTLQPDAPSVHLASALICYWCDKDFDSALRELDQAKGLHADLAEVWEAEAWIRRRQGRWADAVASFRAALELNPRDPLVLTELGVTLGLLRRYDEALDLLAAAGTVEPDNPAPAIAAAEIEQRRGDLAAARRALERAPHQDGLPVQVSWALQATLERRIDVALAHLGGVGLGGDASAGSSASLLVMRGELLMLAGRTTEAADAFRRALATAGPEAVGGEQVTVLSGEMTIALASLGRKDEARRLAARILARCDAGGDAVDCGFARGAAARALAIVGDRQQARELVAELVETPSGLTEPLLRLCPIWAASLPLPAPTPSGA